MGEGETRDVAARLHSASIRLLRTLRREDDGSGALSLAELAEAEQVRPPTMSRIVDALVDRGLITRVTDPRDRRSVRILATAEGQQLLSQGRERRVHALIGRLGRLAESERRALARGVEILERVAR
jgi:DNA-binding MarR family transcriptional regulator